MKKCPYCAEDIQDAAIKCKYCGSMLNEPQGIDNTAKSFTAKVAGKVTSIAGVEEIRGFSLAKTFAKAFKKHSDEEVEDYFTIGALRTTPPLSEIPNEWPQPWVFLRILIFTFISYFVMYVAWAASDNLNLVPGLILLGSFAGPVATLVFFWEINIFRNISFYQVVKLMLLGGVLSLLFSLILFGRGGMLGFLGASSAGMIEEPAKIFALFVVARSKRFKYSLNGLVLGAAIGAGFSAFESAGYALRSGFHSSDAMITSLTYRGLLSPFTHVLWTAIAAGALWNAKGSNQLAASHLFNSKFLRVFLVSVVLHMFWNSEVADTLWKYLALGFVGWTVAIALLQTGMKQVVQVRELSSDKPELPKSPVSSPAPAPTKVLTATIKCPNCPNAEEIHRNRFENIQGYKNFIAVYSSFFESVTFTCIKCEKAFTVKRRMLK